ncbi:MULTISPECIES: VRR-NUC domain-containing protein [Arthrobacter]|uniref:VRR-NUC domain-containing protein n=2 Tax=Arthrobacter TaxID=1663 RepID=A0ABU9KJ03_9MICC|nr:VRR-NUC domain-containing protein [Arthrobacter sp. YJM1]MDP5226895.1 VRR-NUC domain-containing protein [Arthrobacter sp. YJM1]
MREQKVEAHLLARCREVGFLCWKFTSPGRAGVPDRVVVAPTGTVFVETKRPGGKLRRLQEQTIEKMRRAGAEVHVVDTVAGVDVLVERLVLRTPTAVSS